MRARIGRLIAIAIAIILGVAFVVGSFVLADSMRSGFDTLFSDAFANTDLQVRTELAFGDSTSDDGGQVTRDPVPAELVDTVAAVPGVADADGMLQRTAQIIDSDGEAITTGGAPMFGASWDSTDPDNSIRLLDGDAPVGARADGHRQEHRRPQRPRGRRPGRRRHDDRTPLVHALRNRRPRQQRRLRWRDVCPLGPADGRRGARSRRRVRCHRHPCRRR